ncbi:MAG: hypothetical protein ACXWQO_13575 [Bdellovibrionota bacterium]
MKFVFVFLFLTTGSQLSFAAELPKFNCSIQQVTAVNGKLTRTTFVSANFSDISQNQRLTAVLPAFVPSDTTLDVYANVIAVEENAKVRIYLQVTPHDVNQLLGAGLAIFDIEAKTMEVEVQSQQGVQFSAIAACVKL